MSFFIDNILKENPKYKSKLENNTNNNTAEEINYNYRQNTVLNRHNIIQENFPNTYYQLSNNYLSPVVSQATYVHLPKYYKTNNNTSYSSSNLFHDHYGLPARKGGQVRFTPNQIEELEKQFHIHKYLSPENRKYLAELLCLTDRQVKTWFQNRRAKWRRNNNLQKNEEVQKMTNYSEKKNYLF